MARLVVAISLFTVVAELLGCGGIRPMNNLRAGLQSIRSDDLLKHIKILASDEFEGRAPGSKGEKLTINYLIDQFRKLGLEPGNPNGSYLQKIPLVGLKAEPQASFSRGSKIKKLSFPDQYVAISRRLVPQVEILNADMVFVGYGVVAPEYEWDDYKNVDVEGKTIIILVNDPPIPDPKDPSQLDPAMFKGKAMTYYGRWTYKYEIAREMGASAAVLIHETGPAGYPYEVVSASWGQEIFYIRRPSGTDDGVAVESWISLRTARELFQTCGLDFEELKTAAISKYFRPILLDVKANFTIRNRFRQFDSYNVIARLLGSDPKHRDEHLIFTAHWDHLGKDEDLEGDQIFNGALDNASGVAALLEITEAFTHLNTPPKRSILFLAPTAEEQGLFGAKYYTENPLYPLVDTVANLNIDGINPWGCTKDIVVVGLGNSTLEDVVREVAESSGRFVKPEPEPEKGFFYRSDHFEFARQGVPALYINPGTEFLSRPDGFGRQKRDNYTLRDYHKVSDEIKPDWNLEGAVEDIQLLFQVGHRVAEREALPHWKPGAVFKKTREKMLKKPLLESSSRPPG